MTNKKRVNDEEIWLRCYTAALTGILAGQAAKAFTDAIHGAALVATESLREIRRLEGDPRHQGLLKAS